MSHEEISFDVVIVGAGPAGLSAAIRLKQLEPNKSVCVLEKSAEIGGHLVSGAVLDPSALTYLLPQWQEQKLAFNMTPVTQDRFYYLTAKQAWRMPTPPQMKNHGNYIISLSQFARFLAQTAEGLGVEIFPGFAAAAPIIENNQLVGVMTGAMGIQPDGSPGPHHQPGMCIKAPVTLLAEGARGSLTKDLLQKFNLQTATQPQTYAIGLKEVWEIPEAQHQSGLVWHSIGWPLDHATYGGSFVYHAAPNRITLGYVIGLDYTNPYLNPYRTMQQFKHHPCLRAWLQNGQRIAYGARALTEGGWQSLPQLAFPGGRLLGCAAGMVNTPQVKGIHNAMWSGITAAETWIANPNPAHLDYDAAIRQGRVGKSLKKVRNIRPGFQRGLWTGLANAAFETVTQGYTPWTLKHHADHLQLQDKNHAKPYQYPKPDGQLSFDIMTSVRLTGTNHHPQPCHLQLANQTIPIEVNYLQYASPETRYCPANVYEIVHDEAQAPKLQINAQNCIHCKTCDIKDPKQNINWVVPQGGDGPNYSDT